MIYDLILRLVIGYLTFTFLLWDWDWYEEQDKRIMFLVSIIISYFISYLRD
jgi:hypothetical protein